MDRAEMIDAVDRYNNISFDVFDTLLMRPYVRPTDLFTHMELNERIPGFSVEREDAERRARRKICTEITLDEIYDEISKEFRGLKGLELEYERSMLTPDPEMKKVFEHAVSSKKRVLLISDMYLPSSFIREVLEKNGLCGFSDLYVSCEHRINKHSGELYHHVLSGSDIDPKDLLHIGDNHHSDHEVPERLGIASIHYPKAIDQYFSENRRAYRFYRRKKNFERSVLVSVDAFKYIADKTENKENDYWYRFGYRFGGPISSSFVSFIASCIDKNALLLFIARDGYNLKKVCNIMFPELRTEYVYALRLYNIVFGDGYDGTEYERYVVEYFSKIPEVKALISSSGMSHKDIFTDNAELFTGLIEKESRKYGKYLNDIVGDSPDVCIADVTTMKFSSQKLIEHTIGRKVTGFYYTLLSKKTEFEFKRFNDPQFHNWTNVNLSEFLMSSPEYPVTGMTSDGRPEYQTDNPECEVYRTSIAPEISKGCEDHALDVMRIFGDRIPNISHGSLCRWMESVVRFSSGTDREHIHRIRWASSPDHKKYMSAVLTPDTFFPYLVNKFKELMHRIRR